MDLWLSFYNLEGGGGDLGCEAVVCTEEFLVLFNGHVDGEAKDLGHAPCSCDSGREMS